MACETGGLSSSSGLWLRRSDAPKFARTRVATKHLLTYINLTSALVVSAEFVRAVGRLSHLRTTL